MHRDVILAGALLLGACEEPTLPPPPIGGTRGPFIPPAGGMGTTGGSTPGGGSTPSGGGTETLDDGSGSAGGGSGSAGSSDTTGLDARLLTGRVLAGLGPANVVPDGCWLRVHPLEALDPGTGLPIATAYETYVTVIELPQPYQIVSVPGDAVAAGDEVYVSLACDVDGDGEVDDIGAYYPELPLEPVVLPAAGIDLALDIIF